jgi:hypothetical protein
MKLDSLETIACLANDIDRRHDFEESDETLPHHVMVIYYQDPDSICHAFVPFS